MRVKGMNALFDVKFHVTVNDRTIVALATATGFFVSALPSPRPPKLQQARGGDEQVSLVIPIIYLNYLNRIFLTFLNLRQV